MSYFDVFNGIIIKTLKSVWTHSQKTILTGDNIYRRASGRCCCDVGNSTATVIHMLCKENPLLLVVKFQSPHTGTQVDGWVWGAVICWV